MSRAGDVTPTLDAERAAGEGWIIGVDEVGRGAIAGPVSVGAVAWSAAEETVRPQAPAGVRDSKELKAVERERLAPLISAWAVSSGVGHASAAEVDAYGIVGALRLAGRRAIHALLSARGAQEPPPRVGAVLLDGSHDWLSAPAPDLFGEPDPSDVEGLSPVPAPVRTIVKGDRRCLSIAAASVLAKVERDAIMAELAQTEPAYAWERNKGYGSAAHRAALRSAGITRHHRASWHLMD